MTLMKIPKEYKYLEPYVKEYIRQYDLPPEGPAGNPASERAYGRAISVGALDNWLERDRVRITRSLRKIESLRKLEDRLGEEFEGPVSSKYLYPTDKKLEIAAFRGRLQAEVDDLINANVRKQAEPVNVAKHIRRSERLLEDAWRPVFKRVRRPYGAYSYKDVTNRHDATPRTVFGTEAWRQHMSLWNARSSWKFSTRDFFKNASLVVPCVQRAIRKEVMHAKKHNRGHRVRHRVNKFSDIWC